MGSSIRSAIFRIDRLVSSGNGMTIESGAGCGREVLDGLAKILTPDTTLRWHRAAETISPNCLG